MKASIQLIALSITLLVSAPVSAIGLPELSLRNIAKGGVVTLIGAGAVYYYFQKQKTEQEITTKSMRMQETDAVEQAVEIVTEIVGQPGAEPKLDHVDMTTGDIVPKITPETGLGKIEKLFKKKIIPAVTVLLVLDETRTKMIKGLRYFGLDVEAWMPEVPNMSK